MPQLNQKGAIQFIVLLILLGGIAGGVYLATREEPLKLFPFAKVSRPIPPRNIPRPTKKPRPTSIPSPTSTFGKAAKFNNDTSNSAYAKVGTTKLATGNPFTVEAWIKVAKPSSGNYIRATRIITYTNPQLPFISSGRIFSLSTEVQETSGTSRPAFGALLDRWTDSLNGHLAYMTVGQGSGGDTTFQPNQWYHIAATSESVGRQCFLKMYVNGVMVASTNRFSPDEGDCQISKQSPQELVFAKALASEGGIAGYYYSGEIDEVRVSNVVRYTSNFTPSTAPFSTDTNTLVLYHFDGNANDSSANAINAEVVGDVQFVNSTIGQ